MFGSEFPEKRWYLYDTVHGTVLLKHPYKRGMEVPCPHCGKMLVIENYQAQCCDQQFKTGFGEIHQKEPVGEHQKTAGRGWQSLRPYH